MFLKTTFFFSSPPFRPPLFFFCPQLKDSNYELADKDRLYSQINSAYRNLEVELDQRSKVVDDLEMLLQQTEERSNQIIAELQAVKTDANKTVQVRTDVIRKSRGQDRC